MQTLWKSLSLQHANCQHTRKKPNTHVRDPQQSNNFLTGNSRNRIGLRTHLPRHRMYVVDSRGGLGREKVIEVSKWSAVEKFSIKSNKKRVASTEREQKYKKDVWKTTTGLCERKSDHLNTATFRLALNRRETGTPKNAIRFWRAKISKSDSVRRMHARQPRTFSVRGL